MEQYEKDYLIEQYEKDYLIDEAHADREDAEEVASSRYSSKNFDEIESDVPTADSWEELFSHYDDSELDSYQYVVVAGTIYKVDEESF